MLDFTRALYLGLPHSSASLGSWEAITTGQPAALAEPPEAKQTAAALANLVGCERAVLATSTLHVVWDLISMLGTRRHAIFVDAGTYPVARWGVERAGGRGVPVRFFRSGDPGALRHSMRRPAVRRLRPIVVTDGLFPGYGTVAPLPAYLRMVERAHGQLVVDDSQAIGILGESRLRKPPWGRGGGGTARWFGLKSPRLTIFASLAKAFGAPLAFLAGRRSLIDHYTNHSQTRQHASPPSVAAIRAARNALALNYCAGDTLRDGLLARIRRFQSQALVAGIKLDGGVFPVQALHLPHISNPQTLHDKLHRAGIRTALTVFSGRPHLTFLITALHSLAAIDHAVRTVALLAFPGPRKSLGRIHSDRSRLLEGPPCPLAGALT